jgi:hypothetical protein
VSHEPFQVIGLDSDVVNGTLPFVHRRLVIKVEPPLADGHENISGTGHVQVGQDLSPEHFLVKYQGGIEIGSKQMGMMNVVLHV